MTYDSSEEDIKGEIHEDIGFISYDTGRKKYLLRQFYSEGYINQFVLDTLFMNQNTFVFITENVENRPSGLRARITWSKIDLNSFSETFELAIPGKKCGICLINRWRHKLNQ